jgi:hypothetical protein
VRVLRARRGGLMKRSIALLALAGLAGCSSVKMEQRGGCWVRKTERLGNTREELGPCGRPPPEWTDDRITRIVQECVAQDDFRWQGHALAAWSRGQPLPERPSAESVLATCMAESARAAISENERLQARLEEVSADRTALAARTEEDRGHLLESYDRLAADLGEAAKKPQPPATATATATTSATTDGSVTGTAEGGAPPTTVVATAPASVAAPAAAAPGSNGADGRDGAPGAPGASAATAEPIATAALPIAGPDRPTASEGAVPASAAVKATNAKKRVTHSGRRTPRPKAQCAPGAGAPERPSAAGAVAPPDAR